METFVMTMRWPTPDQRPVGEPANLMLEATREDLAAREASAVWEAKRSLLRPPVGFTVTSTTTGRVIAELAT